MQKTAAFLKNVRQEKGFTIDDVSKSTKISPSVIRALEEGRLDGIDPVYLKGFLKLYCRFLGIDWEQFLKEYPIVPPGAKHSYKTAAVKKPKEPQKKEAVSIANFIVKNKKIILMLLCALAAVLFLVLLFRGCVAVVKKMPRVKPAAAGVKEAALKKPTSVPVPNILKQKAKFQASPVKKLQGSNPPIQTASPAQKEVSVKAVKLGMLVKEDSFVKVMVDGRLVYQDLLRKGKQETWTAKEKIELSVGNAAGIELEVEGKKYFPLGRRGQAIKNIVIDRGGLKILQ